MSSFSFLETTGHLSKTGRNRQNETSGYPTLKPSLGPYSDSGNPIRYHHTPFDVKGLQVLVKKALLYEYTSLTALVMKSAQRLNNSHPCSTRTRGCFLLLVSSLCAGPTSSASLGVHLAAGKTVQA